MILKVKHLFITVIIAIVYITEKCHFNNTHVHQATTSIQYKKYLGLLLTVICVLDTLFQKIIQYFYKSNNIGNIICSENYTK